MPSKSLACAQCGGPMYQSATSLPPGRARCHPCRRDRPARARPGAGLCRACGVEFKRTRKNLAYCSDECRATRTNRFATRARGTTVERGYGSQHRTDRRLAAALHHPSHRCARCGEPLGPMGPQLHYDHNGDRTGYLGFSHARCNLRAGAREGNRRRLGLTERPRRNWYA